MAGEIVNIGKLTATKNGQTVGNTGTALTQNMQSTLNGMIATVQSVPTVGAAVAFTNVTTTGEFFACLRNADATNYVDISEDGGTNYRNRMRPGETWGPCRVLGGVAGTSIYAKANAAACNVSVVACDAGDPSL